MKLWRLLLVVVVGLGMAPATCVHNSGYSEPIDERPILTFKRLPVKPGAIGEMQVAGAWEMDSPNHHFDSYSALIVLGDGTLLAASDRGRRLRFTPPGNSGPGPQFDYFDAPTTGEKGMFDIEALTREAVSGRVWAAYESTNLIARFGSGLTPERQAHPRSMRGWPGNSGPEAMVRLGDGRFVVLAEASRRWFAGEMPGVLFAGDPVEGAAETRFRFRPPAGYRPVDLAPLPDGRVLILTRRVRWGIPPGFAGKLVLADPAAIRPGEAWSGTVIADLDDRVPSDNYEGLAVEPGPDGTLVLWLISDDNSIRLQRTLLLKLLWGPNEKARETSRAPW